MLNLLNTAIQIIIFPFHLRSGFVCASTTSSSSEVIPLLLNSTTSQYKIMEILRDIFEIDTFKEFDFLVVYPERMKFLNSPWDDFLTTKSNDGPKSLESDSLNYRQIFSNFQFLFLEHNTDFKAKFRQTETVKSDSYSSSCKNGHTIVYGLFSNFTEAESFKNEIENYYDLLQNPHVDCSPFFFIVFVQDFARNKNDEEVSAQELELEQGKLEEILNLWASKFDIGSQVYLVVISKSGNNSKYFLSRMYEFYKVKSVRIVQQVSMSDELGQGQIQCQNQRFSSVKQNENQYPANSTELLKKINLLNILQKKTCQRSNFHLANIVAVSVDSKDFEANTKYRYEEINETHRQPFFESGINVFQFWYIRDALNFSDNAAAWPEVVKPGPNKTLVGMAIPINSGEVDLTIVFHSYLEYRVSGPDGLIYLQPTFHNPLSVCFKQPPPSSFRNIFAQTFTSEMWFAVIGTWFLILTSLLVANLCLKRVAHYNDSQICSEGWLWAFGATCQQGWHIVPQSTSMKIIFILGAMMALIVYIAYSASLVSILSVQVFPVNTFQDLVNYKFNIRSDSHISAAANALRRQEMLKVLPVLPNGRAVSVDQNIENLIQTRMAIVTQLNTFYPILRMRGYNSSYICPRLSTILYSRRPVHSGWLMKKGTPLRKYFNYKLLVMKERGVMFRLRSRNLISTRMLCLKRDQSFLQLLGLSDLLTAFAVYLTGVSISIFCVGAEKLYHSFLLGNFPKFNTRKGMNNDNELQ